VKVVIHSAATELRGSERQALLIATELARRGHEVVVSCDPRAPFHQALARKNVRTVAVRPRGDFDPWNFARFVLWLRRERPDALLLTTWRRIPTAALAGRAAGVPKVVLRLGIPRPIPARRDFRLAFRHWVDALIVNSPDVRDRFLASAPWFRHDRVHLVLNAVEPVLPGAAPLRQELGVPADARLVVSAGGLERRKGFDLLLEAFARLRDRRAWLAVAGTGPDADPLRAKANALGIGERVRFLGHRRDMPEVIASADVFVLASRKDSLANVMLEAMALAIPVVATATGGVPLALGAADDAPPAGWIVPVRDADALAGALDEVLATLDADPVAVAARTEEARRRVREWFSVGRMVDGVETALSLEPSR
jgi:glycosyltransferase involved in cell wall biosynthesis